MHKFDAPRRDSRLCMIMYDYVTMSRIDALSLFAKLVFLGLLLRLDPASNRSEEPPNMPRSSVLRYPSCSLESFETASVLSKNTSL